MPFFSSLVQKIPLLALSHFLSFLVPVGLKRFCVLIINAFAGEEPPSLIPIPGTVAITP